MYRCDKKNKKKMRILLDEEFWKNQNEKSNIWKMDVREKITKY